MSRQWPRRVAFFVGCCLLPAAAMADDGDASIEALQHQVRERDTEIGALKREITQLRTQLHRQTGDAPAAAASAPDPEASDDELADALTSSLVRQGGGVLAPGTVEIEPEFSYIYDELPAGGRRDTSGVALSARFGLPGAMQAEVRLPYVVRDRWADVGTSSGAGDLRLGLSKELVPERDRRPALFAFVQWRTRTGDIDRNPPTGFGQHGLAVGLTTTKRLDPVVLLAGISYTANLGSARLDGGSRVDAGDVFGLRLGSYLAVTPDTSLYAGLALNSSAGDRFDGQRIEATDRLYGVLELGSTTVISRGRFLNIGASIGVTPAAPKVGLTVSLPLRF